MTPIKNHLPVFLLMLIFQINAFSQTPQQLFSKANSTVQEEANLVYQNDLKKKFITTLDFDLKKEIQTTKPQSINLEFPIDDNTIIEIEADINPQMTNDIIVKTRDGISEQIVTYNPGVHYFGTVKGKTTSLFALSVFDNEIMGVFAFEGKNYNIQKATALSPTDNKYPYVIFQQDDFLHPLDFTCHTNTEDITEDNGPNLNENDFDKNALITVPIYIECDYEMYRDNGSNETNTTNYATGLFNVVSGIFANAGSSISISEIDVWTAPDPYGTTNPNYDSSDVLNEMFCNFTYYNGRIAHLLSTVNAGHGGVANAVPNVNNCPATAKSWGYSNISNNYNSNLNVYSWSVNVFAHELGHQLGSWHTHNCVWNGNNTSIDDCGAVYWTDSQSCSGNVIPSSGTIMSYCHVGAAGIDLSLGFHPQVATRISNYTNNCIAANYTDPCPDPRFSDITVSNINGTSADFTCALTTGVTAFQWRYRPSSGGTWISSGQVTANPYTATGLNPSTNYDIQVRVICTSGNGNSGYSCSNTFNSGNSSCAPVLTLSGNQNNITTTVQAGTSITSNERILGSSNVIYNAGSFITLNPIFEVQQGALFTADIVSCFTGSDPINSRLTPNPNIPIPFYDNDSPIKSEKKKEKKPFYWDAIEFQKNSMIEMINENRFNIPKEINNLDYILLSQ